jgi:hypothetical protein
MRPFANPVTHAALAAARSLDALQPTDKHVIRANKQIDLNPQTVEKWARII